MITLHHLTFSRSTRVIWLLEALGLRYDLVTHDRDADFRAPDSLKIVHSLGRAPVLVDGDLVLIESSAILRYLEHRYGSGRFTFPAGSNDEAVHDEWLDFVEGSAFLPVMMVGIGRFTGGLPAHLAAFVAPELAKIFGYVAAGIGDGPFLMGDRLTLADMQMSYYLDAAQASGLLVDQPVLTAYLDRLNREPGLIAAIARGGAMSPFAG